MNKNNGIEVFANSIISLKEIDFKGVYTISSKSKTIDDPYIKIESKDTQVENENIESIELEADTNTNLNLDLNFDFDEIGNANIIEELISEPKDKDEKKENDMLNDFLSDFEILEKDNDEV